MKTRVFIAFLVVVMGSTIAGQAAAQDTITLMFDDPVNGLQRYGYWSHLVPFDIVVLMEATESSAAAEFVMTEMVLALTGMFRLTATKINNTPLDLGDNMLGEYVMSFAGCVPEGTVEIVRLQYFDSQGYNSQGYVLSLRGLQQGNTVGSSFDGEMGYVDCDATMHVLTPVRWSEMGMPDDPALAGAVLMNPRAYPIPVEGRTVTMMKSRY